MKFDHFDDCEFKNFADRSDFVVAKHYIKDTFVWKRILFMNI